MRSRWLPGVAAAALLALPLPPRAGAWIREPAVAGAFYPADPGQLRSTVGALLREAAPPGGARPVVIVAPHAGYRYSGAVAAAAWRRAEGQPLDLVVILGTNHTAPGFRRVAVHPGSGFRTPLGVAEIDAGAARALAEADPDVVFDAGPHAEEHSVEVQVPFAQVLFPAARILPVVIGAADPALCERLGQALARVVRGRRALVVASTDLSHYPAARDAAEVDGRVLAAVASLDAGAVRTAIRTEMARGVPGLVTCACGEGPILAGIAAARALGASRGTIVRRATSADAGADPARAVGYGAVVFGAGPITHGDDALDPATRGALLAWARHVIACALDGGARPARPALDGVALEPRGAFVTLTRHGELRGCIGRLDAGPPLVDTVGDMALEAALHDPRFPPVTRAELESLAIEISVLTLARPVASAAEVKVGLDGVILAKGSRRAVFLPQVATEQRWGREELLDNLCRKAGLDPPCWREGATLATFQAEVFGEAHRP